MVIRLKLKSPDLFLRTYKTTIQRRNALGVALLTLVCICFNLFIFGCSGSLLLLVDFLQVRREAVLQLWSTRFSWWCLHFLWSVDSRCVGFSSCDTHSQSSEACGIFSDQGSSPCPLHCQAALNHWTARKALYYTVWTIVTLYEYTNIVCSQGALFFLLRLL